jgi:hypothetical protein
MPRTAVTVGAALAAALLVATGARAGSPSTSMSATTTNGHSQVTAACTGSATGGSIDFGDGTTAVLSPPTLSVTHAYASPGTYTAKLVCSDASGGTSTATATVSSSAGTASTSASASVHASSTLTPGALNQAVTQATIASTICASGWAKRLAPTAAYLAGLKRKQMAQYHVTGPAGAYVEDHLIPIALGGAPADPRNLWPQPRLRADADDTVENTLLRQVCAGAIPLAHAQKLIATIKHAAG